VARSLQYVAVFAARCGDVNMENTMVLVFKNDRDFGAFLITTKAGWYAVKVKDSRMFLVHIEIIDDIRRIS
jgi:hypothetical protein